MAQRFRSISAFTLWSFTTLVPRRWSPHSARLSAGCRRRRDEQSGRTPRPAPQTRPSQRRREARRGRL